MRGRCDIKWNGVVHSGVVARAGRWLRNGLRAIRAVFVTGQQTRNQHNDQRAEKSSHKRFEENVLEAPSPARCFQRARVGDESAKSTPVRRHVFLQDPELHLRFQNSKNAKTIKLKNLLDEKIKYVSFIEKISLAIFENFPKFFQKI